jgi:hypothetical protein
MVGEECLHKYAVGGRSHNPTDSISIQFLPSEYLDEYRRY